MSLLNISSKAFLETLLQILRPAALDLLGGLFTSLDDVLGLLHTLDFLMMRHLMEDVVHFIMNGVLNCLLGLPGNLHHLFLSILDGMEQGFLGLFVIIEHIGRLDDDRVLLLIAGLNDLFHLFDFFGTVYGVSNDMKEKR